jgi:hypothetical protein
MAEFLKWGHMSRRHGRDNQRVQANDAAPLWLALSCFGRQVKGFDQNISAPDFAPV